MYRYSASPKKYGIIESDKTISLEHYTLSTLSFNTLLRDRYVTLLKIEEVLKLCFFPVLKKIRTFTNGALNATYFFFLNVHEMKVTRKYTKK